MNTTDDGVGDATTAPPHAKRVDAWQEADGAQDLQEKQEEDEPGEEGDAADLEAAAEMG